MGMESGGQSCVSLSPASSTPFSREGRELKPREHEATNNAFRYWKLLCGRKMRVNLCCLEGRMKIIWWESLGTYFLKSVLTIILFIKLMLCTIRMGATCMQRNKQVEQQIREKNKAHREKSNTD